MIDHATADELDQLAARIARIRPMSNSNPAAFYEERSEVASEIRELATRLRCPTAAAAPIAPPAPVGRQVMARRTMMLGNRTIVVETKREAAAVFSHPFY